MVNVGPPLLCLVHPGDRTLTEYVHSTGGAGLLSLEPGAETSHVEYVVTGKLLATISHLLATNNTHVVSCVQFIGSGIRVPMCGGGGGGEVWIIDTVYNYIDLHVEIQSHVRLLTYGNYTYSVLRFLMALCEEITSAMLF